VSLSLGDAEALFGRMLDGGMADNEIATTLIELADRGETAEEVAGLVRAMRARMKRVSAPEGAIDVCGTGGDGQHSLNVSTAVALVVAACGVPVAKHGNRAASSKAGGADTLEALGLNLARASELAEETLPDLGIAFLFAQTRQPGLARVGPIRKSLGRRTIFNLCGPLANPALVRRIMVGVFDPALCVPFAEALSSLGTTHAWVVHGADGLDEVSTTGPTRVAALAGGTIEEFTISPDDLGLANVSIDALRGGTPEEAADAVYLFCSPESNYTSGQVIVAGGGPLI